MYRCCEKYYSIVTVIDSRNKAEPRNTISEQSLVRRGAMSHVEDQRVSKRYYSDSNEQALWVGIIYYLKIMIRNILRLC